MWEFPQVYVPSHILLGWVSHRVVCNMLQTVGVVRVSSCRVSSDRTVDTDSYLDVFLKSLQYNPSCPPMTRSYVTVYELAHGFFIEFIEFFGILCL